MSKSAEHDADYFLALDRETIAYDGGCWASFRVRRVPPSPERPHGWQYALTFHDQSGDRVFGFDNAHTIDVASGPARKSRRPKAFDHIDRRDAPSKPYAFTSPGQLVEDFFAEVERYQRGEGRGT